MVNDIKPIRTEADYDAALAFYEAFFDDEPAPGSREADQLEVLGMVIDRYETARYPITAVDPVAVIQLVMEGKGYTQADLAEVLGSKSRASEILNRRRRLTLDQVRALHRRWAIPAEALLGENETV